MRNIRFYTLHPDNNLPSIENIYYIHKHRQRERCREIAFSAHQNTENEHNETLYKEGQN